MEHRAQRILRRHLRQQRRRRRPGRRHRRPPRTPMPPASAQFGRQVGDPVGAVTAAADQHHVGHPVPVDEMARQRRTGHAGATGDQRGARRASPAGPVGHGQHDLADVAGLADEPIGLRGAANVKCLQRQRRQDPRGEQPHQLGQHGRDAVGAGLHQIERPIRAPRYWPATACGSRSRSCPSR